MLENKEKTAITSCRSKSECPLKEVNFKENIINETKLKTISGNKIYIGLSANQIKNE